jgi:hypothetical protein
MPAMRQKVVTGLLLMVEDRQREKKKYEKDDGFGFLVGAVWTPHEDLFEYFIQTNIHTDIQTEGRQRTDKDREHPSVRHPELSHHSHHSQHADATTHPSFSNSPRPPFWRSVLRQTPGRLSLPVPL